MSRHREYDEQRGRRGDEDDVEPREPPDPIKSYKPLGKPGPESTLREDMVLRLARLLAGGATYVDAAAAVGTTDACLKQWLARGKEAAAKGETNLYTHLLVEVAAACSHYRRFLLEQGHASIADRGMSDKFIRWRLATSAPLDFTVPSSLAGGAPGAGGHPAFEIVSPAQALETLAEKVTRFLELEDKRAAEEPGRGS